MSESAPPPLLTSASPRFAAGADEAVAHREDEEARLLASIRLEVDTFAAEVRRELNSLRSLLHAAHGRARLEAPAEIGTPSRTLGNHPEKSSSATEASQLPLTETNSQDRIAALKRRLAAKLQVDWPFAELLQGGDAADNPDGLTEVAEP